MSASANPPEPAVTHEPMPAHDPNPAEHQPTWDEVADRARQPHTDAGTSPHAPPADGQDQTGSGSTGSAGAPEPDPPGKPPEIAAVAGVLPEPTPGLAPPGRGVQYNLTGDAQAAARGGLHSNIASNVAARDAAVMAGHIEPGATAAAVAGAGQFGLVDEIDEAEAEAVAKAHEDARQARMARAAKTAA